MDPEEPNNRSSSASTFRSVSSPTQSPPIQLMERPEHYELEVQNSPNQFPSTSSSSAWSYVSNESLFSIHVTNSLTHENEESMKSEGSVTFSSPVKPDLESIKVKSTPKKNESIKVESKSKKDDAPVYNLDEPQKVVRWKTQVERLAEECAPPQGHKWQPSPFNDHKSDETVNPTTSNSKPKKKVWWSWCKCGSCNMPKWSCLNSWKTMTCSNCKSKKASSHSTEGSGPKKQSTNKKEKEKGKGCCSGPRCRAWSCFCHCCEEINFS